MVLPEKVFNILSVCPTEQDNLQIAQHLSYLGIPIHFEVVNSPMDFKSKLYEGHWGLVLFMPNVALIAMDALKEVKTLNPDLPFVLISNGIGEEEVANIIKAGAEDVVLVYNTHRLIQVVRRVLKEREMKEKEKLASNMAHQAYAARDQMLAIVSHDIKNPLGAIHLEAQMLLKVAERHQQSLLSEEVKIQARRILKTTERLKSLIIDLLDKSKSEYGLSTLNKTEADLGRLLQDVVDASLPIYRKKNIRIKIVNNFNGPFLSFDKNKMFQILNNLLSNAIKFTPEGGCIEIEIAEDELDLVVSFSDNGPGLNAADLTRVFEKYWTNNKSGYSGTGLGLFICRTIVEAHGGLINVKNLPGGGARFWFTIPKLHKDISKENWIKDGHKKILVIDDDDDLREVISWVLGRAGFSVHSYADPRLALEALGQGRHSPHLMVVDFHMDSMTGREFLEKKVKIPDEQVSSCPVIMISASPVEVESSVSDRLYNEIITKPLDLENLIKIINKYVKPDEHIFATSSGMVSNHAP
jgi:signal transduction histidine kinase/ActR/RegA family two-component response regulator